MGSSSRAKCSGEALGGRVAQELLLGVFRDDLIFLVAELKTCRHQNQGNLRAVLARVERSRSRMHAPPPAGRQKNMKGVVRDNWQAAARMFRQMSAHRVGRTAVARAAAPGSTEQSAAPASGFFGFESDQARGQARASLSRQRPLSASVATDTTMSTISGSNLDAIWR